VITKKVTFKKLPHKQEVLAVGTLHDECVNHESTTRKTSALRLTLQHASCATRAGGQKLHVQRPLATE